MSDLTFVSGKKAKNQVEMFLSSKRFRCSAALPVALTVSARRSIKAWTGFKFVVCVGCEVRLNKAKLPAASLGSGVTYCDRCGMRPVVTSGYRLRHSQATLLTASASFEFGRDFS